eukprot:TRINITY_DN722_c1_g1_i1.p1 TRINITY_DN722_c1_g1~~TRINITY_DN722_c1_g1_i1.p1  ORF type:complete len:2287 (+),score=512.39 TRINITY_DN722_c1_g1_i1:319-7179(+)
MDDDKRDIHRSTKYYTQAIGEKETWEHLAIMNSKNAESLVNSVLQNTTLTRLVVNGGYLGIEGGFEFAKLIKNSTTLTALDISAVENAIDRFEDNRMNELGEKGCTAIFKALRYNTTLKELKLANQKFMSRPSSTTGRRSLSSIKLLAQILQTSNALTSLDVSGNNIGDDGANYIASALESNHSVTALILDKNELKKSLPAFSKALEKNHTITKLSLRMNKIDPQAIQPVIEVLKNHLNRTLVDMPTNAGASLPGMSKNTRTLDDLLDKNKQYLKVKKEIKDRLQNLKGTALVNELLRVEIREYPRDRVNFSYFPIQFIPPACLEQFPLNLSSLFLFRCGLNSLPEELGSKYSKSLKRLDIHSNKLKSFPKCLERLFSLSVLDLSDNKLTYDPTVSLGGGFGSSSSSSVASLPLGTRTISKDQGGGGDDQIAAQQLANAMHPVGFCPDFVRLEQMTHFYLSWNQFTTIPSSLFRGMKDLEHIDLSHNSIAIISGPTIKAIANTCMLLKKLDLHANKITTLPEEMGELYLLEELYLEANQLEFLPVSLGSLKYLQVMSLKDNPLTMIPKEANLNLKSLMSYLRALAQGSENYSRVKLMFVGEGNVGKTSLLASFLQLSNYNDDWMTQAEAAGAPKGSEPITKEKKKMSKEKAVRRWIESRGPNIATDGIDIHEIKWDDITYKSWDFAGQDLYQTTHQFFLSRRAIYLMMFNLVNKEITKIEYWLQSLRSKLGPNIPVIIVGTHLDDPRCTKEYVNSVFNTIMQRFAPNASSSTVTTNYKTNMNKSLIGNKKAGLSNSNSPGPSTEGYARYPTIVGIVPISTATWQGVKNLQRLITKTAKEWKFVGDKVPTSYNFLAQKAQIMCQELAAANKPPLIPKDKFKEKAVECNVDPESTEGALEFLHQVGEVMYFGTSQSTAPPTLNGLGRFGNSKKEFASLLGNTGTNTSFSSTNSLLNTGGSLKDGSSSLSDTVFLDPQWLTHVLATIVTLRHNLTKDGRLNHDDLPLIWKPPKFPTDLHPMMLQLLTKFEIAYPLKRSPKQDMSLNTTTAIPAHLIPCLLDESRPDKIAEFWPPFVADDKSFLSDDPNQKGIMRQYTRIYHFRFLPLGFFPRLFVRTMNIVEQMHNFKKSKTSQDTGTSIIPLHWWRSGMVLSTTHGEKAIIEYNPAKFTLTVRVRVPPATTAPVTRRSTIDTDEYFKNPDTPVQKVTLLNLMMENIDTLVRGWFKDDLEKTEIPCAHCLNLRGAWYNPWSFDLAECEQTIARGGCFLYCRNIYPVRIDLLASDIAMSVDTVAEKLVTIESNHLTDITKISPAWGYNTSLQPSNPRQSDQVTKTGSVDVQWCKGKWNRREVGIRKIATTDTLDGKGTGIGKEILEKINQLRREVLLTSGLRHPNIMTVRGLCMTPDAFMVITDCVPICSLWEWLHQTGNQGLLLSSRTASKMNMYHGNSSWAIRMRLVYEIASGMGYLHSATPPIVHRQLSSDNILVMSTPLMGASSASPDKEYFESLMKEDTASPLVKITNFGLSLRLSAGVVGREEVINPNRLAPEVIAGEEYTEKVDIYNFAILMWELLTKQYPYAEYRTRFKDVGDLETAVRGGLRPSFPKKIGVVPSYVKLIEDCWHDDPDMRPTFTDILAALPEIYNELESEEEKVKEVPNMDTAALGLDVTGKKNWMYPSEEEVKKYMAKMDLLEESQNSSASNGKSDSPTISPSELAEAFKKNKENNNSSDDLTSDDSSSKGKEKLQESTGSTNPLKQSSGGWKPVVITDQQKRNTMKFSVNLGLSGSLLPSLDTEQLTSSGSANTSNSSSDAVFAGFIGSNTLHSGSVQCLLQLPTTGLVWIAHGSTISIWDPNTYTKVNEIINAHNKNIYSMIYAGSDTVWTGASDETIGIWDTNLCKKKKSVACKSDEVSCLLYVRMNPDHWQYNDYYNNNTNNYNLNTDSSGGIIYDENSPYIVREPVTNGNNNNNNNNNNNDIVHSGMSSSDTDMIWAGTARGTIRIYKKKNMGLKKEIKIPSHGEIKIGTVGVMLQVQKNVWVASEKNICVYPIKNPGKEPLMILTGHGGNVHHLLLISNHVWSCSTDTSIRIWTLDGRFVKSLQGHQHKVFYMIAIPPPITKKKTEGGKVYSFGFDTSIMVWKAEEMTFDKEIKDAHRDTVSCAVRIRTKGASRNGWEAWMGCWDRTIRVWRSSGSKTGLIEGETEVVVLVEGGKEVTLDIGKNITGKELKDRLGIGFGGRKLVLSFKDFEELIGREGAVDKQQKEIGDGDSVIAVKERWERELKKLSVLVCKK